jgi:hypothetical protein
MKVIFRRELLMVSKPVSFMPALHLILTLSRLATAHC